MKGVELYGRVRHAVQIEGLSRRIARQTDPSRPYPGNERRQLQAKTEQAALP